MKKIVRERYKKYKSILINKQDIDNYSRIFENNKDDIKYLSSFVGDDQYWVMSITKITLNKQRKHISDYTGLSKSMSIPISYSLYMHKYKDLAVLKSPLICSSYDREYNNNIRFNFILKLKKINYLNYHINTDIMKTHSDSNLIDYGTHKMKILIDKNKTGDDFIRLINLIDDFNKFVMDNNLSIWNVDNKIIKLKNNT